AAPEPMAIVPPSPDALGVRPLEAAHGGQVTTLHSAHPGFDLEQRPPSGWLVWLMASAISLLWALAPIAFAVGYRNQVSPLQDDRFGLAVFALLAIGPAFFVLGAAYMI